MYRRITLAIALALLISPIARRASAEEPAPNDAHQRKWAQKLGLTDDQTQKLDALRASERAEMKPLRETRRTLSEKLQQQLNSKAGDDALKDTLSALADNHTALEGVEEKFRRQRMDILTPTQQAQMMVSRMEHHQKFEKKGGDRNASETDEKNEKGDGE